ncbi:acid-sensing ion channel 1C-like [Glandiceps talaboti]
MELRDNGYGIGRSRKINNNAYSGSLSYNIASRSVSTDGSNFESKPASPSLRWIHWASQVSDIHGVKHTVGETSRIRKLLWTLFVLTSLGVLLFQCVSSAVNYAQFYHITKLDIEYLPHMPFPAITVCNFNKYRRTAITPTDMVHVGQSLGLVDEEGALLNPELFSEEFLDKWNQSNWAEELKKKFDFTEFTQRAGHHFNETILDCIWNGHSCTDEVFTDILTHYGNCFIFNKYEEDEDQKHSKRAGTANGLNFVLDVNSQDHIPTNDLEDSFTNVGFKLMIHSPHEPPYLKQLGFAVGPGNHYFIALKRQEIMRLSEPYAAQECDKSSQGTKHFHEYSMSACRIECETALLFQECGCKLVEQPGNASVCSPQQVSSCAHEKLDEYIEGHIEFDCPCHIPCKSELYPVDVSNSGLKRDITGRSPALSNHTKEYIMDNVVMITLFYEELNFETITQLPETTIVDLLGQLGGNMGLFLGASILTLLQIFEYIFDEWLFCMGANRTPKKRKTKKIYESEDKSLQTPLSVPQPPGMHGLRNTTV